jgi:hypothetical protein
LNEYIGKNVWVYTSFTTDFSNNNGILDNELVLTTELLLDPNPAKNAATGGDFSVVL